MNGLWRLAAVSALVADSAAAQHEMSCATPAAASPSTPPLLRGFGDGGFRITTRSKAAQAYFNNGMQLAHAFAHAAAVRAMEEAERRDPCAMCAWGAAWAGGPTINFGKDAKEVARLAVLAGKARDLAARNGSVKERALTAALVERYRDGGGGEPGDLAFAKSMQRLADQYPADDEVAIIAADAWLNSPSAGTPEGDAAIAKRSMLLLEKVLHRRPDYSPAIHFYIHATEIAGKPALAERYADRLPALAPNAQHLIHMPSHTFYWAGRYEDAATVNRRAAQVARTQAMRMGCALPEGEWASMYELHNVVFGLGGAIMAQDKRTALWFARPLVAKSATKTGDSAYLQTIEGAGYAAMAYFADPTEVLALPEPRMPYLAGLWHYARGEAYWRLEDAEGVSRESRLIAIPEPAKNAGGKNNAAQTLKIAQLVLAGREQLLGQHYAEAAASFDRAAALQEAGDYKISADPPLWWIPVRRLVAEAKLAAGDRAGATAAAREALLLRPKDPVSLLILRRISASPSTAIRNGRKSRRT